MPHLVTLAGCMSTHLAPRLRRGFLSFRRTLSAGATRSPAPQCSGSWWTAPLTTKSAGVSTTALVPSLLDGPPSQRTVPVLLRDSSKGALVGPRRSSSPAPARIRGGPLSRPRRRARAATWLCPSDRRIRTLHPPIGSVQRTPPLVAQAERRDVRL